MLTPGTSPIQSMDTDSGWFGRRRNYLQQIHLLCRPQTLLPEIFTREALDPRPTQPQLLP